MTTLFTNYCFYISSCILHIVEHMYDGLTQMAHSSIPYYYTIPNSEFRIRDSEFGIQNSELL